MNRALELAALGLGSVSPNPMVGCVIVYNGNIIGEGFHQKFGGPHAEVNAIASVSDQSLLSESILYVTLEPCSHYGKTPPCADLIIEKKLKKVVIAMVDPNPKVEGQGIARMKEKGIEVEVGICEKESKELNRRFNNFHQHHRPYVILKWAETQDGFIARNDYSSKWISNDQSRQLVHKWRAEEDAILVGTNTAIHDNPSLTVRDWDGRNPLRILIDKKLKVDEGSFLFNSESETIILNEEREKSFESNRWIRLSDFSPFSILSKLYDIGIQSVIVEGGSITLNSFIEDGCWDEARIFKSEETFLEGIEAPQLSGRIQSEQKIGSNILTVTKNQDG